MFAMCSKDSSRNRAKRPSWIRGAPLLRFGLPLVALAFLSVPRLGIRAEQSLGQAPQVIDLVETKLDPLGAHPNQVQVFLFASIECPICNSYAPEFRRLYTRFASSNVVFNMVYPNADESLDAIRKHLKDYEIPFGALRDPRHELVKVCHARVTPEAAVFAPNSGLVYHGRIDNLYVDLGVRRPEATEHDLIDVLLSVLSGQEVKHPSQPATGCSIVPHL